MKWMLAGLAVALAIAALLFLWHGPDVTRGAAPPTETAESAAPASAVQSAEPARRAAVGEQAMSVSAPGSVAFVTTSEGVPLEGARVWVSKAWNGELGAIVAETGADGLAKLPAVAAGDWCTAFSDAWIAPPYQKVKETDLGGEIPIVMAGRGSAVHVLVRDARGDPAEGAEVYLGQLSQFPTRAGVPVQILETDSAGRCVSSAVPDPAGYPIRVRHTGHAVWQSDLGPAPSGPRYVVVDLVRGAKLEVHLLSAEGSPMPSVPLRLTSSGRASNNSHLSGRTAEDGTLSFANVAPGEVAITAELDANRRQTWTVQLANGESRVEVLRLGAGGRLVGIAEDVAGQPIGGWKLVATAEGGVEDVRSALTRADGTFALQGCNASTYQLDLHDPALRHWRAPIVSLLGVAPVGGSVTLKVPYEVPCTGEFRARIAGEAATSRLTVRRTLDPGHGTYSTNADGVVRTGPLPPGEYRIWAVIDGESQRVGSRALGADLIDLGLIEREVAGKIRIRASAEAPIAFVQDEWGYAVAIVALDEGRGLSKELPVGQYLVYVWVRNVPLASEAVEMTRGRDAEVVLLQRPGAEVHVTVEGEARKGAQFWTEWRDRAGKLLARRPLQWGGGSSLQQNVMLSHGDYSVQVVSDGGDAGKPQQLTVAQHRETACAVRLPQK